MTAIIDCTLRDGGYLNNWDFDLSFVKKLYTSACFAGIKYFEVGYRNIAPPNIVGKFATCDDDFLFSVFGEKKSCQLSVMADVGKSSLKLFKDKNDNNTLIDMVRVAVYPENLDEAFFMCEELKNKNYQVMLNLMAFGKYGQTDFKKLEKWGNKDILDAVCFADSFGSFFPRDVVNYYHLLQDAGFEKISFHPHNNLQLAFANAIKFIELGGYSVDAAATGIGRGGGILPMELILGFLKNKDGMNIDIIPYFDFIYENMEDKSNLISILCGLKNIHPTRAKEAVQNCRNMAEICQALEDISPNHGVLKTMHF